MRRIWTMLLTLAAVLVTACGGGDSSAGKPAPGSPENPLQALPNPQPTRVPPPNEADPEAKSSAKETEAPSIGVAQKRAQARTEKRRVAAQAEGMASVGKTNGRTTTSRGPRKQKALAPSAQRPCSLVSKAQARAIIGAPILEPLEAPQGPTCIYQAKAGKHFITLTVQTTDFARLKGQVRKARTVEVSNRSALCGNVGRPMLYMPLGRGRVLSVAAPCELASRFAAKAAPHL